MQALENAKEEHYKYELYLSVEEIDYIFIKAKLLLTNGICERFYKTIQEEFCNVVFITKIYKTM